MLNSVNGKTKMREEILKILKAEEIGEHLLDAQISQREVYRQTFALGTTIHHHNRYLKGLKEARAEIENLVSEMAQYIASNRATGGANG
jgi:chromosome partitioning protein